MRFGFLLIFFSLRICAQDYGFTPNWHYQYDYGNYSRSQVAFSLEEALQRPTCIRKLYLWPVDEELKKRIPELVNLEEMVFGYSDMDYFCPSFSFPIEFCRLKNLRVISIIQASDPLPDSIIYITSLRELNAPNNKFPAEITTMQHLEVFSGQLPPKPWPGNFPNLKRYNYSYFTEDLLNFTSLEAVDLIVQVDSNGTLVPDTLLRSIRNFRNLKTLGISSTNPMKEDQLPLLFSFLDGLTPERLLFGITTIKSTSPVSPTSSKLLVHVKQISFSNACNLSIVFPLQMDSLELLICEIASIGKQRLTYRIIDSNTVLQNPDILFSRSPNLKRLTLHFNYDYQSTIDTSWIYALVNSRECHPDTIQLVAPTQNQWNDKYNTYRRGSYDDQAAPGCERALNALVTAPKYFRHLTLFGFEFTELNTITSGLTRHTELSSIFLDVKTQDGKPFPIEKLLPVQRREWVLLRNDASTKNSWWWKKTDAAFWKLQSKDIPYLNDCNVIDHKWGNEYTFSSIPMRPAISANLPYSICLFTGNHEFPHPEIFAGTNDSDRGCPICSETSYIYEDFNMRLIWTCDVTSDSAWSFMSKNKKRNEVRVSQLSGVGEEVITWYDSNSKQSHRLESEGNSSAELRWYPNGNIQYYLMDYLDYTNPSTQYQSYTEAMWDTAGNLQWCRTFTANKIAELRFNNKGHVITEGWIDYNKKPIESWWKFDESGQPSQIARPAPILVPKVVAPRTEKSVRTKKDR